VTSYTETLDRLATTTERQLVAAWSSWQDGLITEADFYAVALAYLAAAENRATALADTALAAYLSAARRRPVPTLGLVPPETDHRPELQAAVSDETDPGGRVGRTGRAVALAAAQDAYGEGMVAHGVPAWTRVLNAGACELCQDLAGDVLPGHAPMHHHKGCGCTQRPVLDTERETA
jgi:hypothetical protein